MSNSTFLVVFLALIALWVWLWGSFGSSITKRKHRGRALGFWLGALLGPIGLIATLLVRRRILPHSHQVPRNRTTEAPSRDSLLTAHSQRADASEVETESDDDVESASVTHSTQETAFGSDPSSSDTEDEAAPDESTGLSDTEQVRAATDPADGQIDDRSIAPVAVQSDSASIPPNQPADGFPQAVSAYSVPSDLSRSDTEDATAPDEAAGPSDTGHAAADQPDGQIGDRSIAPRGVQRDSTSTPADRSVSIPSERRSAKEDDLYYGFAYFPNIPEKLKELSELAEPEEWCYQHSDNRSGHDYPILFNYLRYTFIRILEEEKIIKSENQDMCCFNTGLVTSNQEEIYAVFRENREPDRQRWFFLGWRRHGDAQLTAFSDLPEMARYFDNNLDLMFDDRLEIRVNVEHIIKDNIGRFPATFRDMSELLQLHSLRGAIDSAKIRVKRNYKAAIPQYHKGKIQLLIPLHLEVNQRADLALVVSRSHDAYRASTVLTLDMAYNNARLLTKPDRDWLQP